MKDTETIELALRLWPEARDSGYVSDPTTLDILLQTLGNKGALGYECGLRTTFSPSSQSDNLAPILLPTGEKTPTDELNTKLIANILITRTLIAAGLHVDERVIRSMADTYAFCWAPKGNAVIASPLARACSLWLIALDPSSASDKPLPVSWDAECFNNPEIWDTDYRLISHYDVRERAMDWAVFVSGDTARRDGCSRWTIIEPLLRLKDDSRTRIALSAYAESEDAVEINASAASMLERGRIANLLNAVAWD